MSKHSFLGFAAAAVLISTAASGQLLGGLGGGGGGGPVGGVVGGVADTVDGVVGSVNQSLPGTGPASPASGLFDPMSSIGLDRVAPIQDLASASPIDIADARRARLDALIRTNRQTLERDSDGQPVRRAALVAVDPDPASLALAQRTGFRIVRDERQPELGMRMVTLAAPKGQNIRDAFKQLRRIAPAMQVDFDHIYEPAGGSLMPVAGALAASQLPRPGTRIAMIDGGVASHPALARASIEQRGFAGGAQPTGHGTAIGSLLVGSHGPFQGAARGSQLFVADVYGGNPAAGSATTIVRALAWAASKRPAVINISLVGPANRPLERAIGALRARGIPVVAAVGNDGPAAPPQYPASYAGVIAVTGVDGNARALREANRSLHLDFAAPGADLVAALPGQGYTPVRGTSFAAPLVSARLAAIGSAQRLAGEAVPGKGKVGRGIVCMVCALSPKAAGIK